MEKHEQQILILEPTNASIRSKSNLSTSEVNAGYIFAIAALYQ